MVDGLFTFGEGCPWYVLNYFLHPFIHEPLGSRFWKPEAGKESLLVNVMPDWVLVHMVVGAERLVGSWCKWAVCGGGRPAALSVNVALRNYIRILRGVGVRP